MTHMKAIGPLDGRYARMTADLADIFSEYGLIQHRVQVEIQWLKFVIRDLELARFPKINLDAVDAIVDNFSENDAQTVKSIEKTTNHDVKAVEYFIKQKLDAAGLGPVREWVHFACTSEDINNTAYALMVKKGRDLVADLVNQCIGQMEQKALAYKSIPMMSRTHGQPATPTTMGKEFVNFAWRLGQETAILEQKSIQAKINGATGNYNAHYFVFPHIDWIAASQRFVSTYLGLEPILYTTRPCLICCIPLCAQPLYSSISTGTCGGISPWAISGSGSRKGKPVLPPCPTRSTPLILKTVKAIWDWPSP